MVNAVSESGNYWVANNFIWGWLLVLVTCLVEIIKKNNEKELYPLIPFYVTYLISAVIDGWFISKGKTLYNAINSVVVNIGYYGIVYVLFKQGVFEMNMNFIVMMFGFGMAVHMIGSVIMYRLELKKTNISITN